jgi:D-serine deaminase-like pyridoxal phosphate-dependent protein
LNIDDLITPALLIDKSKLVRNVASMADKARKSRVVLRPHIKTHKCFEIANLQTEYGAQGITVSTSGEAEAFINAGFSDLTLAFPLVPNKIPHALKLAQRASLGVLVDHPSIVTALEAECIAANQKMNVLLKVNTGYPRCGIDPAQSDSIALAQQINDASNLTFGGILTHAGHAYYSKSRAELIAIAEEEQNIMLDFAQRLQAEGLNPETVSIGATPTATITKRFQEGITEIRPGNYVFFDNTQVMLGVCELSHCALSVLASVVSVQSDYIVIDAGAATLSRDVGASHIDPNQGYGVVLPSVNADTPAQAKIISLSHVHGKIQFAKQSSHSSFTPGNHIRIIPNHSCLTTNLFDHYYITDGNRVTDTWPIQRKRLSTPLSISEK